MTFINVGSQYGPDDLVTASVDMTFINVGTQHGPDDLVTASVDRWLSLMLAASMAQMTWSLLMWTDDFH